jgi:hypothetical protein
MGFNVGFKGLKLDHQLFRFTYKSICNDLLLVFSCLCQIENCCNMLFLSVVEDE